MINGEDFYHVLSAVVPLYFVMSIAYASVRWWKIFTPEQCVGISSFVAVFAIPILSFNLIAFTNFYSMNFRFVLADTLQKLVIIIALLLWNNFSKNGSLEWVITLNSLSTLPNTLVVGIPLLGAMYGDFSESLMIQIVVFQGVVWNSLLLFLFEYRAAKLYINENFPENAGYTNDIDEENNQQAEMPPTRVLTKLILTMAWRKIIRNPNSYASALGIVWSLVSFRWHITTPLMIRESIKILSNTGMGMAMFTLGQFMALQASIIPCGALLAAFSMAVRFLVGPAVAAATAAAVGLRGALLQIIIVQAALPLAVVPFVFAKEYNVHAQILSTSESFGLALTVVYYVLLGL
ncbi:hypothetical protein UlMin_029895 [Ulmus minor]